MTQLCDRPTGRHPSGSCRGVQAAQHDLVPGLVVSRRYAAGWPGLVQRETFFGLPARGGQLGDRGNRTDPGQHAGVRRQDGGQAAHPLPGGGGILVLEELEHAKARGAKIYAEIAGYGATADGADMVAPSGEGAVRCMRMAVQGLKEPIDYINPHATSTPVGDIPEIKAIREVFGADMPPISATKSLTGHAQGAAGVHEAIYTLLMMQNGFIAASANIEEIDPECADANIVRSRIDGAEINLAISNSFGFGGTNATLAFRRYNG